MYAMRRKDRALTEEEALGILKRGEYGVLSTADREGLPYGAPLSYVFWQGCVYIHCALAGRKVDNMSVRPRVSFSVVGATRSVFDGHFSTNYESVILDGRAEAVEDPRERREALLLLAEKYLPEHKEQAPAYIDGLFQKTAVYKIRPEAISGKARRPKA